MTSIIEFTGPVLTGPDQERRGLWSVDGQLAFDRPAAAPDLVLDGWVIPGLVDAHCHIGLGPGGDVPEQLAEHQAVTDRNAGTNRAAAVAGTPADIQAAGYPGAPAAARL